MGFAIQIQIIAIAVSLPLVTQCSVYKVHQTSLGGLRSSIIRFPQPWTRTNSNGQKIVISQPHEYEIRRVSDSNGERLLFALKEASGSLSDNVYSVRLNQGFEVEPATLPAWNGAEKVPNHKEPIPAEGLVSAKTEAVQYKGRSFSKSGESWSQPLALVSTRGMWVAVFSYTGKNSPPKKQGDSLQGFIGGSEPSTGEIWIDIYDVSSGEKLITGNAHYSGLGPSVVFSEALWVEDRYLAVPLDSMSQICFLGVLPNK